jgi:predicted ferric reductase
VFWVLFATATATGRELCYASVGTIRWRKWCFRFPTLGRTSLVLSNMIVVVVLCFYKLNTLDAWSWEEIGYRTGFVSIAQLPLIVLLAGKDNIIGALVGVGYERLNWLHRWTARTLWLSVTLHMGFWFRNWARYDYIKVKLTTDPITQRGFAAWCILTFIVVTTMEPMRRINYEVFVIAHLITFAGFIASVWLHAPDEVKIWVWLPIGFFALDRLLRGARILYLNLTPLHLGNRKAKGIWANYASFTPLAGDVTRISIDRPNFTWRPGQHVFLSCHSIVPLQNHPFTIASLPSDGRLEFLVKAQRGGTKTFLDHAIDGEKLPLTNRNATLGLRKVGIEGPYGRMRNLGQFDSVIFFAGSTGATFTVPHMRHIVQSWQRAKDRLPHYKSMQGRRALTRRIRFVWVVKSGNQLDWFKNQLQQVIDDASSCRSSRLKEDRQVNISVYVTCDEELVAEKSTSENRCKQTAHEQQAQQAVYTSRKEITAGKKELENVVEVKSLGPDGQTSLEAGGCLSDGSCCCKATVDEKSDAPICTCSQEPKATPLSSPTVMPEVETQRESLATPNPPMRLVSGRPQPRSIIRKVLEVAEGESAVVACGPRGLQDDIRASVVALSDERAVHKGSGAQGIYLHVEGFEY